MPTADRSRWKSGSVRTWIASVMRFVYNRELKHSPFGGGGGGRKWKGMIRLFYLTLMCLFSLSISSAWAYISLSDARRKRKLIQHSKKKKREREKGEREAAHSTWCILSPNGGHWFVFLKITFSFDQPGGRIDYSNIASLDKKKVDEKKHDKWRSRLSWTCDAAWYSNELCRGKIVGIIQATQTDGMFWQCLTKEKK